MTFKLLSEIPFNQKGLNPFFLRSDNMAIFNMSRTLNAEIRRYGSVIQREITYKEARVIATNYDDLLRIQWELINPFE